MRHEFSGKIRLEAWLRSGGRCEIADCRTVLRPGKYAYDHIIPDQMGGRATMDNCQVICRECHRDKTGRDVGDIAKAKRRERKNLGIRKRSAFAGSRDSKFKKKVDGSVVLR